MRWFTGVYFNRWGGSLKNTGFCGRLEPYFNDKQYFLYCLLLLDDAKREIKSKTKGSALFLCVTSRAEEGYDPLLDVALKLCSLF